MGGYIGRLLRVDLSGGSTSTESLPEEFFRKYLGGRNVVSYFMLKEIPPGLDAYSPDNKLIIAASVLTGTRIPGSSRFSIGALSPLTGGFGESEAGGWWGPELKFAGYDAMIIEGRSDQPVYLSIEDDKV